MFLAFLSTGGAEVEAALEACAEAAASVGLTRLMSAPGARLMGAAPAPALRCVGAGVVVGDLFSRASGMATAPGELFGGQDLPEGVARTLLSKWWGRYVALLRAPDGGAWEVLRDPSGAREALIWSVDDIWRVADTLSLPSALTPACRIEGIKLAGWLADPVTLSGELALEGVEALAPGELRRLTSRAPRAPRWLWSPTDCAERLAVEAPRARVLVREVVAACARGMTRPLAEVSGGFDSSVVASALVAARGAEAVAWIHHVVEEAEADERDFGRAAAAHLGLALRERLKPEAALRPDDLTALGRLARPSLNATDVEYERAMVEAATDAGCDGFVTGQGGDAAFLTLRSSWLGADRLQRRGLLSLFDAATLDIARASRTSVWKVARRAILARLRLSGPRRRGPNLFASRLAVRLGRAGPAHPWLRDAGALAPGKRAQVEGLAEALVVQGECARSRAAPLVHPLMSQPVLELCLAIPADILVHGGRDRAWARETFAEDLAPAVAARRGKGDLTAYYGRMVAAGRAQLAPFLLEGVLAARGLLDRSRLARALDPERLAIDGLYADIMDLAAIEAWARAWPG